MSYRPDRRTVDDLLAHTLASAATVDVPAIGGEPGGTGDRPNWADVLQQDEFSFRLLERLLDANAALLDHQAELPDRAARHWLEQTLGIPALEPKPASAIVAAQRSDDFPPILIPAGTSLRGPKDGEGNSSTFTTVDTITATGARVEALHSYGHWPNTDAAAETAVDGEVLVPFPTDRRAAHELILCSDLLAFTGGMATVTVEFVGLTGSLADLVDLDWSYSTSGGDRQVLGARQGPGPSSTVVLELDGECSAVPLSDGDPESFCYLKAAFPPGEFVAAAEAISFEAVKLTMERDAVKPDGAFYNDGVVDIEREFSPFGDVPKRGDGFYVQCDEALGKPLAALTVNLVPLSEEEYTFLLAAPLFYVLAAETAEVASAATIATTEVMDAAPTAEMVDAIDTVEGAEALTEAGAEAVLAAPVEAELTMAYKAPPAPTATIEWETFNGVGWAGTTEKNRLTSVDVAVEPTGAASEPTTLAGVEGRFVRAFLRAGDFGWDEYLKALAAFGTAAASGSGDANMPVAPKAPMLKSVSVSYTTDNTIVDRVVSRVGSSNTAVVTGGRPFLHPLVATTGRSTVGAVYVGLAVDDAALGQMLSLYFDVQAAAACFPSAIVPTTTWQTWSGTTWTDVAVADATSGLRTANLVRFVAPPDWPVGCPDTGDSSLRWVRLLTDAPGLVGVVKTVVPDAVVAVAEPDLDGTVLALDAPPAGKVKGPSQRIDGIDKMTNPVTGTASRSPEEDLAYIARAPQVVRTRNRLVNPRDYEMDVVANFPEVAFVSALPHFDGSDDIVPGVVSIVVIPHSPDPAPLPSADLVTRIESSLAERAPVHATVAVICPVYQLVAVDASIVLARGQAALSARGVISSALDSYLHPLNRPADSLGRPVYRSELITVIEDLDVVDRVDRLGLLDHGTDATALAASDGPPDIAIDLIDRPERIEPPSPARLGMIVSSGLHDLNLVEQLA